MASVRAVCGSADAVVQAVQDPVVGDAPEETRPTRSIGLDQLFQYSLRTARRERTRGGSKMLRSKIRSLILLAFVVAVGVVSVSDSVTHATVIVVCPDGDCNYEPWLACVNACVAGCHDAICRNSCNDSCNLQHPRQ